MIRTSRLASGRARRRAQIVEPADVEVLTRPQVSQRRRPDGSGSWSGPSAHVSHGQAGSASTRPARRRPPRPPVGPRTRRGEPARATARRRPPRKMSRDRRRWAAAVLGGGTEPIRTVVLRLRHVASLCQTRLHRGQQPQDHPHALSPSPSRSRAPSRRPNDGCSPGSGGLAAVPASTGSSESSWCVLARTPRISTCHRFATGLPRRLGRRRPAPLVAGRRPGAWWAGRASSAIYRHRGLVRTRPSPATSEPPPGSARPAAVEAGVRDLLVFYPLSVLWPTGPPDTDLQLAAAACVLAVIAGDDAGGDDVRRAAVVTGRMEWWLRGRPAPGATGQPGTSARRQDPSGVHHDRPSCSSTGCSDGWSGRSCSWAMCSTTSFS